MKEKMKQEAPKLVRLGNNEVLADAWNSRLKLPVHSILDMEFLNLAFKYARLLGFGKIIAYVAENQADLMAQAGYEFEGEIAGYLNGQDVWCCSRFVNRQRRRTSQDCLENGIIDECFLKNPRPVTSDPDAFAIRSALESDLPAMMELFAEVFTTYPSPLFDKNHLLNLMRERKAIYHVAVKNDAIMGAASAEIDWRHMNAELGDCATRPQNRGLGVMRHLLASLETALESSGINCRYSLARASHPPVNHVFHSLGYKYSGRMVNNCQICGAFEDMNIWVKHCLL